MAEVQKLAEMVSYQEGSVVSRTLIKGKTGTVTLFAFDKGQGLSEHTAPFAALVQVIEGAAEVTVAGVAARVGEGDVIIMPADQPHALQAPERFKMLLTMVRS